MSIGRVLNGIGIEAYGKIIADARSCLTRNDGDGYNEIKANLPAVTFCGIFAHGHKADECTHYNDLLVIDIDKLDEITMNYVKGNLNKDQYVAAFWLSPSGKGFKGLVHLIYDKQLLEIDLKERHRLAFQQLFKYLLSKYNISLDPSGKDISRLCYMSSDPDMLVKDEAEVFPVIYTEEKHDDSKKTSKNKNVKSTHYEQLSWNKIYGQATNYKMNGYNRSLLTYIYKKLAKRGISITETWENWVKVAFAIASSVHPEKGRELFLQFCSLDGEKNDIAKSERLIWDAYNKKLGKCSISTIIYLAKQKGIVLDR
jgi:hypothetical protein